MCFAMFFQSLEVLAEKCLSSCEDALQPGAGLRRILECISSGLLLNGNNIESNLLNFFKNILASKFIYW